MQIRLIKSVKLDTRWLMPGVIVDTDKGEMTDEIAADLIKDKAAVEIGEEGQPVPPPAPEVEEPEEDEEVDEEEEEFTPADELCQIDGVNNELANALVEAGYLSLEDVATADPKDLVKISGIGKKISVSIVESASELLNESEDE